MKEISTTLKPLPEGCCWESRPIKCRLHYNSGTRTERRNMRHTKLKPLGNAIRLRGGGFPRTDAHIFFRSKIYYFPGRLHEWPPARVCVFVCDGFLRLIRRGLTSLKAETTSFNTVDLALPSGGFLRWGCISFPWKWKQVVWPRPLFHPSVTTYAGSRARPTVGGREHHPA